MDYFAKLLSLLIPSAVMRSTATVRYAFPLLFLSATFVGLASVISNTPSAINLELKTSVVAKGSDFQIDVFATANVPVNAIDLQIEYPPDVIEVLGIDKGQSVITLWTDEPKANNGTISLSGGTYRKGFVGKHLVATINARAKQDGKANFVVKKAELLAGDGKASVVATKIDSSRAEIAIASMVAPATDSFSVTTKPNVAIFIVTDIDQDGVVTMTDISKFMKSWLTGSVVYDFNSDGSMTINDFSILLSAYIKT